VAERTPTTAELRNVRCPAALVRAGAGFFPDSETLISEEARKEMADALDLRSQTRLLGANHYSLLYEPNVAEFAGLLTAGDPQDWTDWEV
jgi:hypothetical protein